MLFLIFFVEFNKKLQQCNRNLKLICNLKGIINSFTPFPLYHFSGLSIKCVCSASLHVVMLTLCQKIPDFLNSKYRSYNPIMMQSKQVKGSP